MSEFPRRETAHGRELYCRKRFFTSLSDQKSTRLPAAPEDKRRTAKPGAIVKILLHGEAGKRTARQCRWRRYFPGCHDGKRRTAAASLEGPSGGFPRSHATCDLGLEGKIRLVQTLDGFDKAIRGAAPGRRKRLGGNASSDAYPGGLIRDRQLDCITFAEEGVPFDSAKGRIRAKVRRKPRQHFFRTG